MSLTQYGRTILISLFAGMIGMWSIGLAETDCFVDGVALSVLLWGAAVWGLRDLSLSTAIWFGAVSPFIGGAFLGGVPGVGYAIVTAPVSMPIGMTTGFLIRLVLARREN